MKYLLPLGPKKVLTAERNGMLFLHSGLKFLVKGKHTTMNPFFSSNPFLTNLLGVGVNSLDLNAFDQIRCPSRLLGLRSCSFGLNVGEGCLIFT